MASLRARVSHLHATEEQWDNLKDFLPAAAELIIYDKDNTHNYPRFKIGDGETLLIDLPFFTTGTDLETIDGGEISSYNDKEELVPEEEIVNEQ